MLFTTFPLRLSVTVFLLHMVCCTTITWTSPTTTPPPPPQTTTLPPGSCLHEGKLYMNGDAVQTDPNNCGGLICQNGGVIAWDAECAFHTPECNGTLVPIEGQCCPDCRETTTPPKTPTPPARTCNLNGTVYQQGEEVKRDPNNCWGQECMDGEIVTWTLDCLPVTCNDPQNIPGKCCQVCPETTTPKTTTPTTLTECYINGSRYFNGQRLNTDPCNVCRCINNNQTCTEIQCEPIDTLDCASDTQIRPYDTCCFTCGSSRMETTFTWLLLIATFLTRVCHHI